MSSIKKEVIFGTNSLNNETQKETNMKQTTITAQYLGNLRTKCTHLQSNTQIITDAPTDNRGKGESFSPTDLLAASFGSCIMTIMGIVAADNQIDIEGTVMNITKIMENNPRRVAEVIVEFNFPNKNYSDEEKKMIASVSNTSPVPLSVHSNLKQNIKLNWKQ